MSLSITSNISAMGAARSLDINNRSLQKNIAHLSSGLRISDASDDAAGLAISQQQTSDVNALGQAARNANDGVSMVQVAAGAMSQQASVLSRMKELAVQAMNGTYSTAQIADTNTEFQSLINEVDRIASSTSFNGVNMLSSGSTVNMQVGVTAGASDSIAVTFSKTDKGTLAIGALNLTGGGAAAALTAINTAIDTLSTAQAKAGAAQNQLQSAHDNATSESTNLSASVSQIRDVDVASESSDLARNNVLVQAGTAVLAQANQLPSSALSLLRG
jgi:flagellin